MGFDMSSNLATTKTDVWTPCITAGVARQQPRSQVVMGVSPSRPGESTVVYSDYGQHHPVSGLCAD